MIPQNLKKGMRVFVFNLRGDGLITDDEYTALTMIGSESARRLESYDALRTSLADLQAKHAQTVKQLEDMRRIAQALHDYTEGKALDKIY